MEDLDVLANRLNLASERVLEAKSLVQQAVAGLEDVPSVIFPGLEAVRTGYWSSGAACAGVGPPGQLSATELSIRSEAMAEAGRFLGAAGVGGLQDDLDDLAAQVRLARVDYEEAERRAGAQISAWQKARATILYRLSRQGGLAGLFATAGMAGSVVAGVPGFTLKQGRAPSLAELLRAHHGDVRALLGSGLLPDFGFRVPNTAQVARGVTAHTTLIYGDGLQITVDRLTERADSAPTGVEDIANRIGALSASREADRTKVAVSKFVSASGQVSWLVTIPGTADPWLGNGPNAANMDTNLRAIAGDTNAIGIATLAALDNAGAVKGQPVVLAGHSQGGIVSAQLAADPDFNEVFTVAGILTLGSPVSQSKPRQDQQWLSVEHVQDAIPALAPANARGANHTTVVRDLATAADPAVRDQRNTMSVYHGTPTYAATGQMIDAENDLSLRTWREAVAPVLDQTATVTTYEYVVERAETAQ
jgi:alpha-beta hydrolase superfamily lysophospholipase